jgi:hypothetical protein
MNNEQAFQNMITIVSKDLKELKNIAIIDEEISSLTDVVFMPASEIYTPHPYSVYALCKLYEYFQRN